ADPLEAYHRSLADGAAARRRLLSLQAQRAEAGACCGRLGAPLPAPSWEGLERFVEEQVSLLRGQLGLAPLWDPRLRARLRRRPEVAGVEWGRLASAGGPGSALMSAAAADGREAAELLGVGPAHGRRFAAHVWVYGFPDACAAAAHLLWHPVFGAQRAGLRAAVTCAPARVASARRATRGQVLVAAAWEAGGPGDALPTSPALPAALAAASPGKRLQRAAVELAGAGRSDEFADLAPDLLEELLEAATMAAAVPAAAPPAGRAARQAAAVPRFRVRLRDLEATLDGGTDCRGSLATAERGLAASSAEEAEAAFASQGRGPERPEPPSPSALPRPLQVRLAALREPAAAGPPPGWPAEAAAGSATSSSAPAASATASSEAVAEGAEAGGAGGTGREASVAAVSSEATTVAKPASVGAAEDARAAAFPAARAASARQGQQRRLCAELCKNYSSGDGDALSLAAAQSMAGWIAEMVKGTRAQAVSSDGNVVPVDVRLAADPWTMHVALAGEAHEVRLADIEAVACGENAGRALRGRLEGRPPPGLVVMTLKGGSCLALKFPRPGAPPEAFAARLAELCEEERSCRPPQEPRPQPAVEAPACGGPSTYGHRDFWLDPPSSGLAAAHRPLPPRARDAAGVATPTTTVPVLVPAEPAPSDRPRATRAFAAPLAPPHSAPPWTQQVLGQAPFAHQTAAVEASPRPSLRPRTPSPQPLPGAALRGLSQTPPLPARQPAAGAPPSPVPRAPPPRPAAALPWGPLAPGPAAAAGRWRPPQRAWSAPGPLPLPVAIGWETLARTHAGVPGAGHEATASAAATMARVATAVVARMQTTALTMTANVRAPQDGAPPAPALAEAVGHRGIMSSRAPLGAPTARSGGS
ncbi:unnamed protein product, partial [Prorocentrum cordatum]